jgi:hypothetical protein
MEAMDLRKHDWQALECVNWTSPPLAGFHSLMRDIEAKFGPPVARDQDSNGVGLCDCHCLRFSCGLEVTLLRFHLAPGLRAIDPLIEPSWFEILANERDLDHVGFHLGIARASLSLTYDANQRPFAVSSARRFRVMRQDDNGNRFVVKSVTSRCEANALAGEYESRGHKQTYWVDQTA